jgi:hypothetical protein
MPYTATSAKGGRRQPMTLLSLFAALARLIAFCLPPTLPFLFELHGLAIVRRRAFGPSNLRPSHRPDISCITALIKACRRSAMAEISCVASDKPMINPVSCWGKKPLGIT